MTHDMKHNDMKRNNERMPVGAKGHRSRFSPEYLAFSENSCNFALS